MDELIEKFMLWFEHNIEALGASETDAIKEQLKKLLDEYTARIRDREYPSNG
jgi:hypothetical protein